MDKVFLMKQAVAYLEHVETQCDFIINKLWAATKSLQGELEEKHIRHMDFVGSTAGTVLEASVALEGAARALSSFQVLIAGACCVLSHEADQKNLFKALLPRMRNAQYVHLNAQKAFSEMLEWVDDAVHERI